MRAIRVWTASAGRDDTADAPAGELHAVAGGDPQTACGRQIRELHQWTEILWAPPRGRWCMTCFTRYPWTDGGSDPS